MARLIARKFNTFVDLGKKMLCRNGMEREVDSRERKKKGGREGKM